MRYKNLEPPYYPPGFSEVLKWAVTDRVTGKRPRHPSIAPVPVTEPDLAAIERGDPSLTWVGHATWLVRLGGQSILTDPVWSRSLGPGLSRNVEPGLELERAAPTIVLVSHNHRDHLDAPTIDRIGPTPTYCVPEGLGAFFRGRGYDKVIELSWWHSVEIGGVRIHFVPSQHWSRRGVFDANESLWGGYVIEGNDRTVYFAGDTAYFEGFKEIGRRFPSLDAALLPIGSYEPEWFMRKQHMNPEDAMAAFESLGAKLLCAMHWGTFKLTDEPLDQPPKLLEEARARAGIAAERVHVSAIGQTRPLR